MKHVDGLNDLDLQTAFLLDLALERVLRVFKLLDPAADVFPYSGQEGRLFRSLQQQNLSGWHVLNNLTHGDEEVAFLASGCGWDGPVSLRAPNKMTF
jgi:hypothetical protein